MPIPFRDPHPAQPNEDQYRYSYPDNLPPTVTSTAHRVLTSPPTPNNRPINCDCGERAGWFKPNHYYCAQCKLIIQRFPKLGQVEWTLAQWKSAPPKAKDYEASWLLEPLDPAEF